MIAVAIVTRRLRPGRTYDDFRRAWFHTVGFGASNRMLTVLGVDDPREVTVIGLTEVGVDELMRALQIDVEERLANPLDEVIEPQIDRRFGVLVAEDDFSADGAIDYRAAQVGGRETDLDEVGGQLEMVRSAIATASAVRDGHRVDAARPGRPGETDANSSASGGTRSG